MTDSDARQEPDAAAGGDGSAWVPPAVGSLGLVVGVGLARAYGLASAGDSQTLGLAAGVGAIVGYLVGYVYVRWM